MATTNIELDIENITGVADADDQFIISAQKFVVASIPKELLRWAASETVPATHGGDADPQQVTIPTGTDSIISVRRDSYVAKEVGIDDRGFIGNSNSLHLATNTFPKYFVADANRIIVKPDPDGTYKIYVTYIDYSNLDDDSDLRNAVVFHASAQEFEKLASSKITDWSDLNIPVAPSISSNSVSFSTSAPVYVLPPSFSQTAFSSYSSGLSETDPGVFSISSVAPVAPASPSISSPGVGAITIASLPTAPSYTGPVVTPDFSDANTWLNTEEDSEMVSSRVQVIGAQLNEFQSKLQDSLNKFNKENAVYQAGIQKNLEQARIDMQDAQKEADLTLQASIQDYTLELQRFQADLGKYQADVAKEVQEYGQKLSQYQLELNTSFQAWSKTESDKIAKYQSDIQNELNDFNEGVTEYQAQLQISIQDAQLSSQDDAQKLQKYSQELQSYTSEVNQKAQKIASATQNASYYSNESKKYYDWAIAEVTMYIKNNSKMINQTMAAQAAQG